MSELGETCMNEDRTCANLRQKLTQPCSLDVPELRLHLKMRAIIAAPVLRQRAKGLASAHPIRFTSVAIRCGAIFADKFSEVPPGDSETAAGAFWRVSAPTPSVK